MALAFVGCLFVVKPGFHNAEFMSALIGVCGGLGAGIAYTMVRVLGTHGVKGPIIVFYFSVFSCLSVIPWMVFHFTPMTVKQFAILMMAGLFAAGGQFTITAAYTYAPAGKISIFDYSQIIFATLLGFFLFGEVPDKYSFTGYAADHSGIVWNIYLQYENSFKKGYSKEESGLILLLYSAGVI